MRPLFLPIALIALLFLSLAVPSYNARSGVRDRGDSSSVVARKGIIGSGSWGGTYDQDMNLITTTSSSYSSSYSSSLNSNVEGKDEDSRRFLFVANEHVLMKSEQSSAKKIKKKREHPPPLAGTTCETSMSYEKYRKWFYQNGVQLCDPKTSPSQIVCSSRIGRFAFFCVGYNILSLPKDRNSEIESALNNLKNAKNRKNSNSNIKSNSNSNSNSYFFPLQDSPQPGKAGKQTYDIDRNHFVAGCNPAKKWTEATLQEFLRILPDDSPLRTGQLHFNVQLYNHIKSSPETIESHYPFTYVASGDCATGNPGHCIADPHNFLIMQKVLDKSPKETRVLFYSGFGSNKYDKSSSTKIALIEDWWPLSSPENVGEDIEGGLSSSVHFPMMGFNAIGLNGPHWRHYVDFGNCNRTSKVLLDAKAAIEKFWNITSGNRAAKRPSPLEIAESSSESVTLNSSPSSSSTKQWKILWILRTGKDRIILNANATIVEMQNTFGGQINVETVDFGVQSYHQQLTMTKKADIVMGMHGGAILQAVRWMDPDQHLLEVTPDYGPGSACFFAKMMGVPYHFNKCKDCVPAESWNGRYTESGQQEFGKWNGNVNSTQIVQIIRGILDQTLSGNEIDCFDT